MLSIAISFALIGSLGAAQVNNSPRPDREREISKCDTHLRLCNDVADIDRNNCDPTGKDCTGEYLEDRKECASDYSSCIGSIAKTHSLQLKFDEFKAKARY
jgi:hypothetical protein